MADVLYLSDLEKMQCGTPGCDHSGHDHKMFIHSKCHPQAGASVEVDWKSRVAKITCAKCDKFICRLALR